MIAVLVAGGILHFAILATIPGVNGDEAEYGVLAMTRGTAAEFDKPYLGLYYTRLVGVAIRLFGATAFALRVWPALAMTILPLVGFVALRAAPMRVRALVALLLLAHPVFLVFGRLGWDVSLLPLVVLAACACFAEQARRVRGNGFLVAAAVMTGVAATLHPTGWLVVPAGVVASIACLRGGVPGAQPRSRASTLLAAAAASVAFLVVTLPRLRFLAYLVQTRLGTAGASVANSTASSALDHASELLSGAIALRWITGVSPWPPVLAATMALGIACLALGGLALAFISRDAPRAARVAAQFAFAHLVVGAAAMRSVDFAAPGNIRYALGLYPSLIVCVALCAWLARLSPPPLSARRRGLAVASEITIALIVVASLAGWRSAFWRPLRDSARAVEATFVPGRGADPKAAAVALIDRLQRVAGNPPAALVPKDWHLYHTLRYFSGRRWPVLRIDSHEPRDFAAPFADLAARHERLYCVVFERAAGAEAPLARYLCTLAPGLAIAARDTIADRANANIITVYTLARAPAR